MPEIRAGSTSHPAGQGVTPAMFLYGSGLDGTSDQRRRPEATPLPDGALSLVKVPFPEEPA